jgi:hypothetical protein
VGGGTWWRSSERRAVIAGVLQMVNASLFVAAGVLGDMWGVVYVAGALWLFAAAYTARAGVRCVRERRHGTSPETEETG